ncbi:hypothetical protein M0R19_08845 [Candidatus Pacearchaeota archaeon]|jgi:hypothetical protein|nr:hypothetical protein [bacterium]MCK9597266.1 hypothetical protein [Candidatus Pacearchaeota archaeon]
MKIKLTESELSYFSDILKTSYIQENVYNLNTNQIMSVLKLDNKKILKSFLKEDNNQDKNKTIITRTIVKSGNKMLEILFDLLETVETDDYKLYTKIKDEYYKLQREWDNLVKQKEIDYAATSSFFSKMFQIFKTACRMLLPVGIIITMIGACTFALIKASGALLAGVIIGGPSVLLLMYSFSTIIDTLKHIYQMAIKKPKDAKEKEYYIKLLKQKADKIYNITIKLLDKSDTKSKDKYKSKLKELKSKMDKSEK